MEALSGVMKVVQPVMQAAGVVTNILQGNRQWQVQQNAINQQKQLQALISDPQAYAAKIAQLQQPLSQGLQKGVANEVQGYLGERGLSLSPAISEQILAQALGPYQLQEQQLAQSAFLAPYGLGGNATNAAVNASPGLTDTTNFWNRFTPPQKAFPGGVKQVMDTYGLTPPSPLTPPAGQGDIPYPPDYTPYTDFPGTSNYQLPS